jgi:putative endopeptidase
MARGNLVTIALLALAAGGEGNAEAPCPTGQSVLVRGEFAPQGIDVRGFSKTTKPGGGFFNYVNEGWLKATTIPARYWDYGQTSVLGEKVDGQIRSILAKTLATPSPQGTPARQVGDTYASILDTASIEQRGLTRLRNDVRRILASRTHDDIARWMADPTASSIVAINTFPADGKWRVHLDQQNVSQPILGLQNPDAYTRTDAESVSHRKAYEVYVATILEKAGVSKPSMRASQMVALETRIAANEWPFDKLRDRKANFHPMTVDELTRYAPGFPWRVFLRARSVGQVSDVVLGTDTAVRAQSRLFAGTSVDDWRTYLVFHWVQNQIDVLPQSLRHASWEFYNKTLSNAKAPPGRDEVALRLVNSALGPQVGRLYCDAYVTAQTKAAAREMIGYLRKALAERLANVSWMDRATRAEAQAKLRNFTFKVGCPTIWRDYSGLKIRRDDAAGNLQRIRQADWGYQLRRLQPRLKDEPWYETPQTVDASYSVLFNAIELPAAYLQPPYFDPGADPAVNFGAIGAFVGHEMGHGFDDQGIIYDSKGRLRNWWSQSALDDFHARAKALVDQYSGFTPLPGLHVNGERTIGENIADLSGVSLGYRAYHLYLADHPCAGRASIDGLTGDQRFFISWAQAWRYKAPEGAVKYVVEYGFHAPTPYRVDGVVRNMDAWYSAFGVKPSESLYVPPEKRVRIW